MLGNKSETMTMAYFLYTNSIYNTTIEQFYRKEHYTIGIEIIRISIMFNRNSR